MAEVSRKPHVSEDEQQWASLIGRIAQGDHTAVGPLYDQTNRFIYGLISRIVRDPAAAEEVTLDVYIQVWYQAGTYAEDRGLPSTWLFLLARSRALDWVRSRMARERGREQALRDVTTFLDPAQGPEESSAVAQRGRLVRTLLGSLLPEQREPIELAFFGGLTHVEIAARQGVPLGTIKTRIRLGMMRLRDLLQPYADAL